jgi:repressor LexA
MTERYGLTARENDTLNFLQFYISGSDGHIGPTYDEMMIALNASSKSNIHRLLSSLEAKGYISRLPGKSRAIALRPDSASCPHCGHMAQ